MGKTKEKKEKVLVAMSGGVDSSVSAALLKKEGFDVVGIFMKFWTDPLTRRENRCCSSESENRARKVAGSLGIPFYVINFEKQFKKEVVDYFLKECKSGRTPNPCVVCNKEIKFGLLIKKALELGADYIATGHYARIVRPKTPAFANLRYAEGFGKARASAGKQNFFLRSELKFVTVQIRFPQRYTKYQIIDTRYYSIGLSGR